MQAGVSPAPPADARLAMPLTFFRRRGLEPESYYRPRRRDFTSGCAILAGVTGAFYAGATQWVLLSEAESNFVVGFAKYQGAVALGAATFAAAGGAVGWTLGFLWERWHRRRRARHDAEGRRAEAAHPATAITETAAETSGSYDTIPDFGRLYDSVPAYAARTDVAFYLDLAHRTGGPVLELGCGTGRVLLPIARAGVAVVGVDGSRLMLDRCREKLEAEPADVRERVTLHRMDARDLNLATRFPLVIAPFRVLQQIVRVEDQVRFVNAAARHLGPGGWFVFDVFNPNYRALAADRSRESVDTPEFTLDDGRVLRRTVRIPRVRWLEQTAETELIYYVSDSPGQPARRYVQAFDMRWFTPAELEHLLARAGLRATAVYGDFDRSPRTDVSPEQVVRAERL